MPLFILIIIVAMLALDVTWWLCADRAARKLSRPRLWRIAIATFVTLQVLALVWIILGRVIGQRPEHMLPSWVTGAVFLWHFILLPLGTLVWALLGGWNLLARIRPKRPETPLDPAPPALPTRRQFLTAAAAATPPILTGIGTVWGTSQLDHFRVREITIP